ncbi:MULTISPECIES: hypothetical protein [Actinomadura]|uniref:Lipoprotein n=1 Tax=Actinomadura madurae TaxID=1993 RepID=A0A1I5DAV5_9ACTN|nr:hypothetical protein [Actinomadura madurae]SFN96266.1 hypothetical protein SAMN04489713_103561 [Actinomadura madurae]
MNTGKRRPAVSALALLATVLLAAGCGGQGESKGGEPGGARASAARSAQAGSVTVATLSFVPPDKMVRIEPTEQDVVLEMSLGGATDAPGQDVPPPGVQVFQGGRDLANVSVRVGLIEARLKADAPDAQVTKRVVKVPGAAEAAVMETVYPSVAARQLDLVIGTAAGPQYDVRYGGLRSAFDQAGAQRIVSSARISGGGS